MARQKTKGRGRRSGGGGDPPRRQAAPSATGQARQASRAEAARAQKKRRRKTGRRTLHYIILLTFVIAAGVVLSLTVFFKIEEIQVIGTDRYQPADIEEASGIVRGDNLLRIKADEARENILERFPYVESVRVVRRFPPRVELVITQCVPRWAVAYEGEIGLVTEDGKLLERGDLLVPQDMEIVKGISLSDFEPGEYLGGEDDPENSERLVMLRYLFDAAKKTGFGPITNVDVTDRLNMRVVYEARLVLELGSESDMEYKLTFLQEVISDLEPGYQGRLDASNIKDKRLMAKPGRVEGGVFYPQTEQPSAKTPEEDAADEEAPE